MNTIYKHVDKRGIKMDRRKRKTRTAIQKACVELIKEKGFDAMSILDIAERADINRGTFYLHFIDKHDMIDQFVDELMDEIEKNFFDIPVDSNSLEELIKSRYKPLIQVFTIFRDQREILEILFHTKGVLEIQNRFNEIAYKIFDNNIKTAIDEKYQVPQLFFTVFVASLIGIAQYWIQGDGTQTPEELARDLLNIIINGPARAYGLISHDVVDVTSIINTLK